MYIFVTLEGNAEFPSVGGVLARTVNIVSQLQLSNAEPPILVTLLGITTDCNDWQTANVLLPMLVTPLGITTDCNE